MEELIEEMRNPDFIKRYINTIDRNFTDIYKGWWSEILTLEELRKYE